MEGGETLHRHLLEGRLAVPQMQSTAPLADEIVPGPLGALIVEARGHRMLRVAELALALVQARRIDLVSRSIFPKRNLFHTLAEAVRIVLDLIGPQRDVGVVKLDQPRAQSLREI